MIRQLDHRPRDNDLGMCSVHDLKPLLTGFETMKNKPKVSLGLSILGRDMVQVYLGLKITRTLSLLAQDMSKTREVCSGV